MTKKKTSSESVSSANLSRIVGSDMYASWVAMLKALVPYGRTHRLSVIVASMMLYAVSVIDANNADDDPLADALLETAQTSDPDDFPELVHQAFAQLFKDAGVQYKRTSSKGTEYSILEAACTEYARWEDYPWE